MQINNLKSYLQNVLETEKNIYILTKSADKMYNYIQSLGQKRRIKQPKYRRTDSGEHVSNFFGCIIGGAIIGFVISFICTWLSDNNTFILAFFKVLFTKWDIFGIGSFIGAVIGLIISICTNTKDTKKIQEYNEIEKNNYEYELFEDRRRIAGEINIKNEVINYYNVIQNQLTETKQTLDRLYNINIIHSQYRNIVAVASFYQYFDTGRCTTFEGHEGAYNLYESERRMNKIISQLDVVIEHLNDIKNNQYTLYNMISTANNKIDKLMNNSQLALSYKRATAENSEIIAYNAQVAAENTRVLKWMEILKD